MKNSFRQSMSWLHTWFGLTCGWLLCAIFLAGTLSVFREPITQWMVAEPELPALPQGVAMATGVAGTPVSASALVAARNYLAEHAPQARFWRLALPEHAGQALRIFWRNGDARSATQEAVLDPRTGELLPAPWGRRSEGGRHFMTVHYTLHGGTFGFWVVGALSMGMLVALISGVVVHKRIFKDFFTFRPGKGQRSWLDAHNATAVLTLPFQLMIVYTGLAIFYTSYMPWPLQAAYGTDGKAHSRLQAQLDAQTAAGQGVSFPASAGTRMVDVLETALATMGAAPRLVVVERPMQANETLRVISALPDTGQSRRLLNTPGNLLVKAADGAVVSARAANDHTRSVSAQVHEVMEQLHLARFGGWPLKWLYFFCGLAGTAMMATGTLLFSVKRRHKTEAAFGSATPQGLRLIESVNVAAIAGATFACIGYLYGNRLIPAELAGRDLWEIRVFMGLWLLSLVHALLRRSRGWEEQLGAAAALCLFLPLLNLATTGQHVLRYLGNDDWIRAGVEITSIGFGAVLVYATFRARAARLRTLGKAPVKLKVSANQEAPGYRWAVLSRCIAAILGGYVLTSVSSTAMTFVLAKTDLSSVASGVVVSTMSSFLVYTLVVLWVFSVKRVSHVWGALAPVTAAAWLTSFLLKVPT